MFNKKNKDDKARQDRLKRLVAEQALAYLKPDMILGVGSGSTVACFIDALATVKHKIEAAVASSVDTEKRLKAIGIEVVELNQVSELNLYIDGADEFNRHGYLIKGGGAALTREKVIAAASKEFVCIVDDSKEVAVLGQYPLPVEVIPMARSFVARQLVKLGGDPVYRQGVTTDNGNVILDVFNLDITDPMKLECTLNDIPGVVTNGIFAHRKADILLIGHDEECETVRV